MKKYVVKAYGDYEYRLKEQKVEILATDEKDAWKKAYGMFPEYHEIGVWEKKQ